MSVSKSSDVLLNAQPNPKPTHAKPVQLIKKGSLAGFGASPESATEGGRSVPYMAHIYALGTFPHQVVCAKLHVGLCTSSEAISASRELQVRV